MDFIDRTFYHRRRADTAFLHASEESPTAMTDPIAPSPSAPNAPKAGPAGTANVEAAGTATPTAKPSLETGGPKGPEPTRYGDWERKGRCIDF